jgi:hypothetical protein
VTYPSVTPPLDSACLKVARARLIFTELVEDMLIYGTPVSPASPLPFTEPERPRPPDRLPPLVSPSWLSLAASLASARSTSALRVNRSASAAGTSNPPPGSR